MAFVNQYIRPEIVLRSAAEFGEGKNTFVYGIGHSSGRPVIVKSDTNGDTIWCYALSLPIEEARYYQLIQIGKSDSPLYIVTAYDGHRLFLVAIRPDGKLAWVREVLVKDEDIHAKIARSFDPEFFYLVFSDKNDVDTNPHPRVMLIDEAGEIKRQVELFTSPSDHKGFVVNTIASHSRGLLVAGRLLGKNSIGITVDLDQDLKSNVGTLYNHMTLQDSLADGPGFHLLSAYSSKDKAVVLIPVKEGKADIYLRVPRSQNMHSVLSPGPKNYFLSTHNLTLGQLHRLDLNLNPIWTKDLSLDGNQLGVRSLTYFPGHFTFTTLDVSLLGRSDANFENCLTGPPRKEDWKDLRLDQGFLKIALQESKVELEKIEGKQLKVETKPKLVCDDSEPQDPGGKLEIEDDVIVQSPHIYLQGAGSIGNDSTPGIHLRWMFKGALEDHLPKADYAVPNVNFNKPDDYVRIYRAPYTPDNYQFGLAEEPNHLTWGTWYYRSGDEVLCLNFLDLNRYNALLNQIDPNNDPSAFLAAYGNAPLELEHKTRLSFTVELSFLAQGNPSQIEIEVVSVEENKLTAPKAVTFRRRMDTAAVNSTPFVAENIRSIRFRAGNAKLMSATFQFYDQFLKSKVGKNEWQYLGRYALTKDQVVAYQRLEPQPGMVHGKWLRFNEDAYVNVDNYKKKWNSAALDPEQRIRNTVDTYINLSNDPGNPRAVEQVYFNDPNAVPDPGFEPEPDFDPLDNQFGLSNLLVLQLAAMDFHIARMLGLGTMDLDSNVGTGQYIYLAEYITLADLDDGQGAQRRQHIFMSLPTSKWDQRLPLPIDLKPPVPGVFHDQDTDAPQILTDAQGYSQDGRTRFLSLFPEPLPNEPLNAPFYHTDYEFSAALRTLPVYGGIEYRKNGAGPWQKPELPHDSAWKNIDATVGPDQRAETRPIMLPDPPYPLFVHRERESGLHDYSSYGINWFSRAVSSGLIHSIHSEIKPANTLQPPANINALLIQEEDPLILSSASEQFELANLAGNDKTFVRLLFEYNHGQELINYHKAINGEQVSGYSELPDAQELFAEKIEVLYRGQMPNALGGITVQVTDNAIPLLADVTSEQYVVTSAGINSATGQPNEILDPTIPAGMLNNFIGGVLAVDGTNFVIHSIDNSGLRPKFTVFKVDSTGQSVTLNSNVAPGELTSPPDDTMFAVVENMTSLANWGGGNPMAFKVNIDHTSIHRETITRVIPDGTRETHVHKFRGILRNATITKVLEDHDGDEDDGPDPGDTPRIHKGLYKLTFNGFSLAEHSQVGGASHRVEFQRGVVRIHQAGDPNGPRREFPVIQTENIGTAGDLTLYIQDLTFDPAPGYQGVPLGVENVNYYPGYRLYLFQDNAVGLNAANVQPSGADYIKYSIFGFRSYDANLNFHSSISPPAPIFAQRIPEPKQPRLPVGGTYATRPDFYGKASYTFTTEYQHEPYSVQFLRGSDVQILSVIYRRDDGGNPAIWTVQRVQDEIFGNGEDDWYNDRWLNLIGFDYNYGGPPADNGLFEKLPATPDGIRLPLPNNPRFIAGINAFIVDHNRFFGINLSVINGITSLHQVVIPGTPQNDELTILDFMRDGIYASFVPLTEIPVIYSHIKGGSYEPIPKKQVVRDRNGELLPTNHPDFDMAPMAKKFGPGSNTKFADFNIDGASNAKYFYAAREFNLKMKAGAQSPILGPIHLVNAASPRPPEVVKTTPIFESRMPDIAPAVDLQINAYPRFQKIKKLTLYRATDALSAQSIRTMTKVKELDLEAAGVLDDVLWTIQDDFADLGYTPFGDPLFYQITVSREVQYNDRDGNPVTEYVPSSPSKRVVTNIVETYNPDAPRLEYFSTPVNGNQELEQVNLVWEKKVHNGTYLLYKKNAQGNWIEISVINDNSTRVVVPLAGTHLASGILALENGNGEKVFHHFKVTSVNFAGMVSRKEDILTIHQPSLWQNITDL